MALGEGLPASGHSGRRSPGRQAATVQTMVGECEEKEQKNLLTDPLSNDLRKKMMEAIEADPGLNQKTLAVMLETDEDSISYHALRLEEAQRIKRMQFGKSMCCFPSTEIPVKWLLNAAIKSQPYRQIIQVVLNTPDICQSSIARRLNWSPSTVHWHKKKLLKLRILIQRSCGKRKGFQINPVIEQVAKEYFSQDDPES